MLTKRIIAVILLRDGRAVKSKQFANYRDVGDPVSQARIYYANGIDELVILNTQPEKGIQPLLDVLPKISEQCFIPIAAGGGIRDADGADSLIRHGAEKVVIKTAFEVIPEISKRLGCQSVVQCCDLSYEQLLYPAGLQVGAGELLIQSIDHDGMMQGYCMEVFPEEGRPYENDVPMIMLGGCGTYQHMLDAFNAGADGCAAGSLWAFTDSNPIRAKKWLKNHGVSVRT
jgi:imidazole glycerol-phosphate synthase subunit HisF